MFRKQLVSTLRRLAAVAALGAALLPAGAANGIGVANIPFDFEVNGQRMPAGKYYFSEGSFKGIIDVRDYDGRTIMVSTTELGNPNEQHKSKLVFDRTERGYVMAEVWLSSTATGKSLPRKVSSLKTVSSVQPERVILAMANR